MTHDNIIDSLENTQDQIDNLLVKIVNEPTVDFPQVLQEVSQLVADLLILYASAHGKAIDEGNDLLEIFKAFVKGDPTLNAVRDNVREIVYYQNCLAQNREDALPKTPSNMAVRTAQHIYFYLRSRLEQDNLLD